MGIPQHYSRELPQRCLQLIDTLLPIVEKSSVKGYEHLGPLTTTFLLAMATPIITLPVERIERHRGREELAYMNERPLDPSFAAAIDTALGGASLSRSPFFVKGQWRFASIPYDEHNLANAFPHSLSEKLFAAAALDAAASMPASEWASCLRNGLSHGGVIYLDSNGHQSYNQKAEMLAFASAKYPDNNPRLKPERLKALTITETDFLRFLRCWVGWLKSSGLSDALAA